MSHRLSSTRRVTLWLAPLLLLAALALVVAGTFRIPDPRFQGSLHDLLPPPPPGWTLKEKPIADTPEMQEAVGEVLNFSDGIFVDYLGPTNERLSVYIAYWVPGKMSHRLVASHTPDVCWVGGGWKKTLSQALPPQEIGGVHVPSGEDRIFTAQGQPEYVWFWHIVGDESRSYGTGHTPPWYAAIFDMLARGLNQRDEQFFIRISSNSPLDSMLEFGPLPKVIQKIPWPAQS